MTEKTADLLTNYCLLADNYELERVLAILALPEADVEAEIKDFLDNSCRYYSSPCHNCQTACNWEERPCHGCEFYNNTFHNYEPVVFD